MDSPIEADFGWMGIGVVDGLATGVLDTELILTGWISAGDTRCSGISEVEASSRRSQDSVSIVMSSWVKTA